MNSSNLWLIGTGPMAVDYAKVLSALKINFTVIGRGKENADLFTEKTGIKAITGGVESFIATGTPLPDQAIVATDVLTLAPVCHALLKAGVHRILVEKPGALNLREMTALAEAYPQADLLLGYNRRFYSSVFAAEKIIAEDGGITSLNFEFTEWSHVIAPHPKAKEIKEMWFLANSTHVVDLAFFLGGKPTQIHCQIAGSLDWHPSGAVFSGSGVCENNALFTYQANWQAPGRWAVEVLTNKHRLYLKPMEKLQIQKIGSVAVEAVEIDDALDIAFKPGLYKQTEAFLQKDFQRFIRLKQQVEMTALYYQMAGYSDAH